MRDKIGTGVSSYPCSCRRRRGSDAVAGVAAVKDNDEGGDGDDGAVHLRPVTAEVSLIVIVIEPGVGGMLMRTVTPVSCTAVTVVKSSVRRLLHTDSSRSDAARVKAPFSAAPSAHNESAVTGTSAGFPTIAADAETDAGAKDSATETAADETIGIGVGSDAPRFDKKHTSVSNTSPNVPPVTILPSACACACVCVCVCACACLCPSPNAAASAAGMRLDMGMGRRGPSSTFTNRASKARPLMYALDPLAEAWANRSNSSCTVAFAAGGAGVGMICVCPSQVEIFVGQREGVEVEVLVEVGTRARPGYGERGREAIDEGKDDDEDEDAAEEDEDSRRRRTSSSRSSFSEAGAEQNKSGVGDKSERSAAEADDDDGDNDPPADTYAGDRTMGGDGMAAILKMAVSTCMVRSVSASSGHAACVSTARSSSTTLTRTNPLRRECAPAWASVPVSAVAVDVDVAVDGAADACVR